MDTDVEDVEVPVMEIPVAKLIISSIAQKRRRRLILAESSQSTEPMENQLKALDKEQINEIDFNPGIYMRKPHTRASNKLKLKSKIMANPKLRDLIINVEETPVSTGKDKRKKPEKQNGKNPKAQTKQSVVHTRKTRCKEDVSDRKRKFKKAVKGNLNLLLEVVAAMP